eukprot:scaffold69816_cov33-Tisochrysis_lutea.AAC.1
MARSFLSGRASIDHVAVRALGSGSAKRAAVEGACEQTTILIAGFGESLGVGVPEPPQVDLASSLHVRASHESRHQDKVAVLVE